MPHGTADASSKSHPVRGMSRRFRPDSATASSSHEALPLIAPCTRRLCIAAQERPASRAALRFSAAGERPLARPGRRPMSSHYLDHHRLPARGGCRPEPCCCLLIRMPPGVRRSNRRSRTSCALCLGPASGPRLPATGRPPFLGRQNAPCADAVCTHNSRALSLMAEERHSPRFIPRCPPLV